MSWLHHRPADDFYFLEGSAEYTERTLSFLLAYIYQGPREYRIQLPNRETFPNTSPDPKENLLGLIRKVQADMEYNGPLKVIVFDPEAESSTVLHDTTTGDEQHTCTIEVEEELLNYKASLIRHVVLQLCAVKGALYPKLRENDWNKIELLAAWYGYSLVLLTEDENKPEEVFAADLMLPSAIHLYAIALLCRYTEADPGIIRPFLSDEAYNFIISHYDELKNHDRFHAFSRACDKAMAMAPHRQLLLEKSWWSAEAIEAFTALLAIEPNEDDYNDRGYSHLLNGRLLHAENDFAACLRVNPHNPFALNNRGYCRIMMGNLQQGWDDVESSLMIIEDNSYAIRNRGIYSLLIAQPEQALEDFHLALQIDASTHHIHFWLGKAYFALSNMEEAKKQFDLSRNKPELPAPGYPL